MSTAVAAPEAGPFATDLSETLRAELLAGKYRLLAGLGRGGMADVFLGSASGPAGVNKLVVIKRLRDGRGDDPILTSMFLDEARLAARLNHPNIVHTYEVDEIGNEYVIVMEYLEGQPLRSLIKAICRRGRTCEPGLAAHIMAEVLNGLHYVHEVSDYDGSPLGIVHRDISPQNLFVTYDGQVKVLDFGIAKGALNATDTQDGVLKGKFAYMAPEQACSEPIDRRADIFSSGVVLWELLTGRRLFRGETPTSLLQLASTAITPPSSLVAGVPPELDVIVLKALQRSPDARFGSALEMSSALSDFLEHTTRLVRHQDVARVMQQLFAEERDAMVKRVQFYMRSLALEGVVSHEPQRDTSPSVGPAHSSSSLEPTLPLTRRRRPWSFLAAALIAAASAAVVWARAHPSPGPPAELGHSSLVKGQHPEAEEFRLTLSSDPPEAQVEWSGKFVGQTPLLIDLTEGPQIFVLSHDGRYNATVVVNVTPGMAGRAESRTVVMVPRAKSPESVLGLAPVATPLALRAQRERSAAPEPADAASAEPVPLADPDPAPAQAPEDPTDALVRAPQSAASAAALPSAGVTPISVAPVVLPFGPAMTRPVLLSGGDVVIPREAREARVSGMIIARCTITSDGLLRDCRIIKGLPFLDQPMLDCLATRHYRPVFAQGKPVAVQYVFNLKVDSST